MYSRLFFQRATRSLSRAASSTCSATVKEVSNLSRTYTSEQLNEIINLSRKIYNLGKNEEAQLVKNNMQNEISLNNFFKKRRDLEDLSALEVESLDKLLPTLPKA